MAVKNKARKAKAAPEPEVEVEEAVDYSGYRDKAPTDLQRRMADWVLEQMDVVAHDADGEELELDEESFREGIRLGVALRMQFQRSPENQAIIHAAKADPEEEEAPVVKPAGKRKAKAAAAAPVEPEEDDEEPEDAPAPAPKARRAAGTRKAAATKAAAPAAGPRTKRAGKVRAAKVADTEAPF